jgi:protein-disulfide isomerase
VGFGRWRARIGNDMNKSSLTNHPKFFMASSLLSLFLLIIIYALFKVALAPYAHPMDQPSADDTVMHDNVDPFLTRVGANDIKAPVLDGLDPARGADNAKVNMVVFGDYSCGHCRRQSGVVRMVLDKFGDSVKMVWKDFPDQDPGSLSYMAAKAARCAGFQGAYWDFHETLFELASLEKAELLGLAKRLKLKENNFRSCLESPEAGIRIGQNIDEAFKLDIPGTPYMYINSQEIMGEIGYEDLERIVKIELDK